MIKIVDGDLLQANIPLIAHQTNCLGVMGAGIAKAIKNKWPDVYTQYKDLCKGEYFDDLDKLLERLTEKLDKGDLLLVLGAGDLADLFRSRLSK